MPKVPPIGTKGTLGILLPKQAPRATIVQLHQGQMLRAHGNREERRGWNNGRRARTRPTVEVSAISVGGGSRARAPSMPGRPPMETVRRVVAGAPGRVSLAPTGAPSPPDR